jgi:hypothetical protein
MAKEGIILLPTPENWANVRVVEPLPTQRWCQELGLYLRTDPPDAEFRYMMSKWNQDGFWNQRPSELKKLDHVYQIWPHYETVGNHIHSVIQNLNTSLPINGVDYLHQTDRDRNGMIRALRAATLLHDVSKTDPFNANHPYDSAEISYREYLRWMGLSKEEKELAVLLIRHHDTIGMAINRNEASTTIDHIVSLFTTPAILQCAYALTVADISSIKGLRENNPAILEEVRAASSIALKRILAKKNGEIRPFYSINFSRPSLSR